MELLIVNDHEIKYQGLKSILEAEKDIDIISHASSEQEAIKIIDNNTSLALLALDSDKSNLNLCNELYKIKPNVKVLVLSSCEKVEQAVEFLKLGASSLIEKDVAARDLINAIRLVSRGQTFMPAAITDHLNEHALLDSSGYKGLTLREIDILQSIASGFSNKEIAVNFHISEATVKTHVRNILKKIDVTNRTSAVLYAYDRKWIKTQKHDQ